MKSMTADSWWGPLPDPTREGEPVNDHRATPVEGPRERWHLPLAEPVEIQRWLPERQPWQGSCAQCQMDPERQVQPGHDACLPPINGRHTADNVLVTVGLRVWDYDLRPGTVIEVDHSMQGTPDGPLGIVAWHMVQTDEGGRGMFDGSRMCTTHPTTGERPKNCCPSYTEHMYTECPELEPQDTH